MARVHEVLFIGSGFGGSIAARSNWVAARFLETRA